MSTGQVLLKWDETPQVILRGEPAPGLCRETTCCSARSKGTRMKQHRAHTRMDTTRTHSIGARITHPLSPLTCLQSRGAPRGPVESPAQSGQDFLVPTSQGAHGPSWRPTGQKESCMGREPHNYSAPAACSLVAMPEESRTTGELHNEGQTLSQHPHCRQLSHELSLCPNAQVACREGAACLQRPRCLQLGRDLLAQVGIALRPVADPDAADLLGAPEQKKGEGNE